MAVERLRIYHKPDLTAPALVMGFTGWMDGGDVSTGTVDYLRIKLGAVPFSSLDPEPFYIYSFPGSMEITSLFRPPVKIVDGRIQSLDLPANTFYADVEHDLILFSGKEPNLNWQSFGNCIIQLCEQFSVQQILFIGSVAGLTPHTREPRFTGSFSQTRVRPRLEKLGIRFSDYEGPASFTTYLTMRVAKNDLDMMALVAEVPAYLQGYNPKCVSAAVRCISSLLELHMPCDDLRILSDEFEKKVTELVLQQPELSERVQQLEEIYDSELFDTELSDLKNWLHQRGIRLD